MSEQLLEERPPVEMPPIQEPHQQEGFRVHDAKTANFVVGLFANNDAELARVKEWAAEEKTRLENERRSLEFRFKPELQEWANGELVTAKKKSVKLPNGTIGYRAQPDKLEVEDENKAFNWAYAQTPRLLKNTTTFDATLLTAEQLEAVYEIFHQSGQHPESDTVVNKAALLEHFKATGEVPDGCKHIPAGDKFYVK